MNRVSNFVRIFFKLSFKLVVSPVVFLWIALSHYKPRLLKVWNPMPIKVLRIDRTTLDTVTTEDGCAIAYDLIAPALDLGFSAASYESYLLQTTKPYQFTVNRPELLRCPKPATLKKIAHDFEKFGLRVKEIHVVIAGPKYIHTIVHELA